jgi:hypothetical protein
MSEHRNDTEDDQDRASEQSFPASDPPSNTPTKGPGTARQGASAGTSDLSEEHQPKGRPTDDRLASETASAKIQGVNPPQTDHR